MLCAASSSSCRFTSLPIALKPTDRPTSNAVHIRPLLVKCKASTTERAPPSRSSSSSSLYQVLGIGSGATFREIKAAYRGLARVLHPDAARSIRQSSSTGEFIKLHEAYETLSDPEKRAAYDRSLFWPITSMSTVMTTSDITDSSGTSFSPFRGRSWETDQCW